MVRNIILSFLYYSINTQPTDTTLFSALSENDWLRLMQQAGQQSVLGLYLDALDILKYKGAMPPQNVLIKWIGCVMTLEKEYERQKIFIKEFASFFSKHGLKMV